MHPLNTAAPEEKAKYAKCKVRWYYKTTPQIPALIKRFTFPYCIFNFHRRVAQLCFICSANLIAGRITIWFAAVQRLSCNVTAQSIKIGQFSAMSIVSIHSERAGAACVHRHKGGNTDTKARITRANLQWCHAWYNIVWASYARIYPGLRQGWGAAAKEIP
jgi:hypothetical protein